MDLHDEINDIKNRLVYLQDDFNYAIGKCLTKLEFGTEAWVPMGLSNLLYLLEPLQGRYNKLIYHIQELKEALETS